ncbi:MAG: hypothetical protein KBS81_11315 [Spirochaetales bacterium]|nr:hypothetical protein [Candidatus Physcosoma equi]
MKKFLAVIGMLLVLTSLSAAIDPDSIMHSFYSMKLSMANAYASGYAIFDDSDSAPISREEILAHASDPSFFTERLTASNNSVVFPSVVINPDSPYFERKFYLFYLVYSDVREATITIDAPSLKSGSPAIYSPDDSYLPYAVSAQILAGNTARATINIDTLYSYMPLNTIGDYRRKEEVFITKPQSPEGSWAVIEVTVKTDELRNFPADVYSGAITFRFYEIFKR